VVDEELHQQNEELAIARQTAGAEHRRYQELFDFAPYGYLLTDADDHVAVREGVKRILADAHDLTVAGEASHGQEVLAKVSAGLWNLVLLDISIPGRNSLEILRQLKAICPALLMLVFSMHPENQYAVWAFKAGAAGYLTKESLPEELVTAIRRILQGRHYVSSAFAEHLVIELGQNRDKPFHASLSDREYQVFCMLAPGKTVTAVAADLALSHAPASAPRRWRKTVTVVVADLALSVETISTHRSRILSKLHLRTTAELIHYAMRHHLVE
jgi:two-component system invasion response regulator UvrY